MFYDRVITSFKLEVTATILSLGNPSLSSLQRQSSSTKENFYVANDKILGRSMSQKRNDVSNSNCINFVKNLLRLFFSSSLDLFL